MFRRQVNLRFSLIGQGDVGLDEELAASESAALKKPGLGLYGPGDGNPYVALLLGERAPTFGDRAEIAADSDLSRGARVKRDKGRIADLAVAIALPDCLSAFA